MALNNVPLSGQSLDVTRVPINQNFSVIGAAFIVDHVDYNTTGQGKHNRVTFPVQATQPTFAPGEEGLYNFPLAGVNELYVNKQAFAGVQQIPMTASLLSSQSPTLGNGGWTYLPSGYYQTFGSGTGSGLVTITLTYPPPTQLSTVMLTPFTSTTSYSNVKVRLVSILSRTQFRCFISVNGAAGSAGFQFLAIGY